MDDSNFQNCVIKLESLGKSIDKLLDGIDQNDSLDDILEEFKSSIQYIHTTINTKL
jgi:hypothetical protein